MRMDKAEVKKYIENSLKADGHLEIFSMFYTDGSKAICRKVSDTEFEVTMTFS